MRHATAAASLALFVSVCLHAQNAPAPAAITQRLDSPQARVYVATLQPHTPSIARTGHATHRVLIYMDDGVMTRKEGDAPVETIAFKRGDVRWRPSSAAYTAENTSDHPIRILEIDLKGQPGPAGSTKIDPVVVDPQHYKVEFENEFVRVLRIHMGPGEQAPVHEHLLNRVVFYLNDQTGGKMDETKIAGAGTHTEANESATPADRIAVELKSR